MTQTSTPAEDIARYAQVTVAYLDTELPVKRAYLALIEYAQTELEACAAGMWNQGPEQLVLQNRCWSAQRAANEDIVKAALAAGVDAAAIMAITHREWV
jgi:hypothetical protein